MQVGDVFLSGENKYILKKISSEERTVLLDIGQIDGFENFVGFTESGDAIFEFIEKVNQNNTYYSCDEIIQKIEFILASVHEKGYSYPVDIDSKIIYPLVGGITLTGLFLCQKNMILEERQEIKNFISNFEKKEKDSCIPHSSVKVTSL